jgi:hypothetical protein
MKKLAELMKDQKEIKMPEHKAKARLELVQAMKKLAQDLMMEDFQSKMGSPDAMAIKIRMSDEAPEMMSKDEAMDADMDMFKEKEEALLMARPEMEESEDESEDEDEMEDSDDVEKLKMLLKQKKSQDSEF